MKISIYGKDYTGKFRVSEIKSCKFGCMCACTGILFFIPLVSAPESRYGRYWANQGLIILIIELMCTIVGLIAGGILTLLGMIPVLGIIFRIIRFLVVTVLVLLSAAYIVWGMVTVFNDKAKDLPILGRMRFIR